MTPHASGHADRTFGLAGALLAASVTLGGVVHVFDVRLGRWRWIHHALFGAALTANTAAAALDRSAHPRRAVVDTVVVGVLALLPLTSGGSARHRSVGLAALGIHVAGAQAVRRG